MMRPDDSASALRVARESGGTTETETTTPSVPHFFSGAIHSHVAGRTDHLPMTVASGSYVIPADVVSAGGQGNTIAGFKALRRTFGGEPYGESGAPYNQGSGPYGSAQSRATGGRVRASGVMFLSPDNEVLLLRRAGKDHHGEWGFPAGHIEKGETPESAARRETKEESGYDHDGGLSPLIHTTDGIDFTTFLAHSQRFRPRLNEEHDEARWVTSADAQKLPLHPGVRRALAKLADRSRKARGGATSGVPIVAAGGEWVISPEQVRQVGAGDVDMGHRVLDAFVRKVRHELIGTLQKLPGPKKN